MKKMSKLHTKFIRSRSKLVAFPQNYWQAVQQTASAAGCCSGNALCERFIVECSENRRRASPTKINNYTRVALRICRGTGQLGWIDGGTATSSVRPRRPLYVSGHRGIGRRRDRLTRDRPGTMPYGQPCQTTPILLSVVLPSPVQSTLFYCTTNCQKLKNTDIANAKFSSFHMCIYTSRLAALGFRELAMSRNRPTFDRTTPFWVFLNCTMVNECPRMSNDKESRTFGPVTRKLREPYRIVEVEGIRKSQ